MTFFNNFIKYLGPLIRNSLMPPVLLFKTQFWHQKVRNDIGLPSHYLVLQVIMQL